MGTDRKQIGLVALLAFWLVCNGWQSWQLFRDHPTPPQNVVILSNPATRQLLFHQMALDGETADIVFAGDSHIQHGDWRALMGRPVANRGLNGEVLGGFYARLPDLIAMQPRLLVVQIGGNDLEGIVLPPQARKDLLQTYALLFDRIASEAPGTQLVLTSILPVTDQHRGGPPSNAQLPALNAELLTLCRRHPRCTPLDSAPLLNDAAGNLRRDYSIDTEHLNDTGYAVWAAHIRPLLPPAAR